MLTRKTAYSFESSVNSEGIETGHRKTDNTDTFESSVNSEGIETSVPILIIQISLRAV